MAAFDGLDLASLREFIRFPSISSQPERREDVGRCAAWLVRLLRSIGMDHVRLMRTSGHPVVHAESSRSLGRPTVLIYGHYDVQPPGPLESWTHPPFRPVVDGRRLLGRGASDDKGPIFAHIMALKLLLGSAGRLPVNVKLILDGEEEVGSPSLKRLINRQPGLFCADLAVVSDTRIPAPDRPALTYSLRGALSLELLIEGRQKPLHSGAFGGAVRNPIQILCQIIAGLQDLSGRIRIPGFYHGVRTVAREERKWMSTTGPSDSDFLRPSGISSGWGEQGYTAYERSTIRPAIVCTGISGGHSGSGGQSTIPSTASAKVNIRLASEQQPEELFERFARRARAVCPPPFRAVVRRIGSPASPVLMNPRHPTLQIAAKALEIGFGRRPIFLASGGTIPIVSILQNELEIPTVLMGFALPDDRMHAPNEKVDLPTLQKGMKTSIAFLRLVGNVLRAEGVMGAHHFH